MSIPFPQDWTLGLRYFTVFLRLLGLFLFVPVFSHRTIPMRVKILLALAFSVAVHPVVVPFLPPLPESPGGLAMVALRETVIGVLLGFVGYLTFEAVHLAGQFVGYQMGFGASDVLDPAHSGDLSVFVPLQGWIALMIFLAADLHHEVLALFVKSFETTAELHWGLVDNKPLLNLVLSKVGRLFSLAVQMAAPFCLVLLATNAAMGVLARLLPQMNLLLFSFPITITLGLLTLYVVAPELIDYLESILGEMSGDMMELLRTL